MPTKNAPPEVERFIEDDGLHRLPMVRMKYIDWALSVDREAERLRAGNERRNWPEILNAWVARQWERADEDPAFKTRLENILAHLEGVAQAGDHEFALYSAFRAGEQYGEARALSSSWVVKAGKGTSSGGRRSAEATNELRQETAAARRKVEEAEYIKQRQSFPDFSWTRLCKRVAKSPAVKKAWGGKNPCPETVRKHLPHLK